MSKLYLYTLLGFVLFQVNLFAQDVRFRAVADASEVNLGQTFTFTIITENTEVKELKPPSFQGFEAYGPSTMSSYNWINGKSTKTKSYSYTLVPTSEGEFTIGAATGKIDGKEVKTNPVTINVLNPISTANNSASSGQNGQQGGRKTPNTPQTLDNQLADALFVKVIPDKTKVKVGEQVTLTYKIYYKVAFRDIQVGKLPSYNDFLSHEIELDNKSNVEKRENYNNQVYTTQTFKKIALFPTHAGTFNIDPMEFEGVVMIQKRDPFFDNPFFSSSEPYPYNFKSNAIKIEVEELPSPSPKGYAGAVGVYDFIVDIDKSTLQADDAITLKVKVSGQGNIKSVNLPKPELPNSFETYDPKVSESISKQSGIIKGSKTDEYLIIPRAGGTFEIPSLEFSYYDISKNQYITKTSKPFTIEVEGESSTSATSSSNVVDKQDLKLLSEDIRYIKSGEIKNRSASFIVKTFWYPILWSSIFLSIFPILIFSSKHRELQKDVIGNKRKNAGKVATKRLKKANELKSSGTDKEFYQEISTSLWSYLSDKLNVLNSELSKENLEVQLKEKGIDQTMIAKLEEIWSSCEMALYAKSTSSDRESILEKTKSIINQLEEAL